MGKYLDANGLAYAWGKIKSYIDSTVAPTPTEEDVKSFVVASTGTRESASVVKYGKTIHFNMTFTNNSSMASGSNVFIGTINKYRPMITAIGVTYYSSHALVMSINPNGNITIRNTGSTAVKCELSTTVSATWVIS